MKEEQFVISPWVGGGILCVHGGLTGTKGNSKFMQQNSVCRCLDERRTFHCGMLLFLRLRLASQSEHTEVTLCFTGNRACAGVGIIFSHFT